MKKTIIESPWGNFLKLEIGKRTYDRSASGNFWYRKSGPPVGLFWGCGLLSLVAALLPTSEVEPDKFSDMLRATIPPEELSWMKPTSTNGIQHENKR